MPVLEAERDYSPTKVQSAEIAIPPVFLKAFEETSPDAEETMKSPWGSFNQFIGLRRHIRADGKMITKGFAVSIAYMPGVTPKTREDVMAQTLSLENPYVQRWEGEKQGGIFCMSKDAEEVPNIYGLIRKFIQASGDVVKADHPFRNHERVERFLSVQQQRLDFAAIVASDAQRILDTPEFTGWSSMDERYKGEGKVYLIEIYEEDGIVYGSCPDGSMRPLSELPIDECHSKWINDGLISMVKRPMLFPSGYRIGGDGEDTETVSKCGVEDDEYKGSCSDFFDLMENGIISTSAIKTGTYSGTERVFNKVVDSLGVMHLICSACRKTKESCNCNNNG